MDIDKINYFFSAAEHLNFTKAADECGIAQTTMSKYINTLENELGCKLFSRSNKGCTLTEAGEKFYLGMIGVDREYRSLKEQVTRKSGQFIRVGIEGEYHTAPVFQLFEETHPSIEFDIDFGQRVELLSGLRIGKYDTLLLLNISPDDLVSEAGLSAITLPGEKEMLICSRSALDKYGSIEGVISSLPLITKQADRKYQNFVREELMNQFGVTFSRAESVDSVSKQHFIVSMSKGFGIAPLFELAGANRFEQFPMNEIFKMALQMVYRDHDKSPELKELVRFIRKNLTTQ